MNVLIIGLGYAGTRFQRAFNFLNSGINGDKKHIKLAYVCRQKKLSELPYFDDLSHALKEFKPQIIVVTVNDENHFDILQKLNGYEGFIICEKPLLSPADDLSVIENMANSKFGFCLDLIERYSPATILLKNYVQENNLQVIRANFYWGKDRIHDRRPTCGVTSEVIHALDLIQHINANKNSLTLKYSFGSYSDFSISGNSVMDSVGIAAEFGNAAVTGYSSFVNIIRKREVDFTFCSPQNKLVYASLVYDTPEWDRDYLKIWTRCSSGDKVEVDFSTTVEDERPEIKMIQKLIVLVSDVVNYVQHKEAPSQPFADLNTALSMQKLLNIIDATSSRLTPVKYVLGNQREFFNDENDLEKLG